jgi:cell division protein FtsN
MAKAAARDYKPKRKSTGFSGWTGVLCGLALGLGVAAVVYIKDHRPDAPIAKAGKMDRRKSRGNEPPDTEAADSGAEDSAKSYAFYDMLPKFEVVIPEKEKVVHPDLRSIPETRRGIYVLQAGSYKNFADADRVRAQLALQGIESKVQKVTMGDESWHRVRIGPISKLDELNRLQQLLRKADVDALVIRVGD